ncbi:peptidoglycan editing factor PgeF [Devosia beringensis]|uniref:peptidoglycan editing factor PgeF n=1 Tax=Devosia beringensis TaxID=2657486 RepID=UPI00186B5C20|nr:peptidoglycan editing factor PgeF [Devosia beringensis]
MSTLYETSPALTRLRHGFFGRHGGSSAGVYARNNMSFTTGDDTAPVAANRAGVATALGYDPADLVILKQTHSATVHVVTGRLPADAVIEADGMVTNRTGLLLGILTADCTPILFADLEAGIIGAAHAGWRGAVDGIIGNTIAAMLALGARTDRIVAAIGPTISGPNYEVGPQFAADLLAAHPQAGNRISIPAGGVEHFDLPGFVADCLTAAGIGAIDRVGACTYAHPERYFSHRYATHHDIKTGRQVAVIGLT